MKKIIGLLALAVIALSAVPAQAQKKAAKKSETVTFVTNLDCENCAKKILNVIPFKKGVKDMEVDVPTKVVEVKFDPRKTSVEVLVEELKKLDVAVLSINGQPVDCEAGECECGSDHNHEGHDHHHHDHAGHNHAH